MGEDNNYYSNKKSEKGCGLKDEYFVYSVKQFNLPECYKTNKYKNLKIFLCLLLMLIIIAIIAFSYIKKDEIISFYNKNIAKTNDKKEEKINDLRNQENKDSKEGLDKVKEKEKIKKEKKKLPVWVEGAQSKITGTYSLEDKVVYLTFDDGPSKNVTPKVLKMLKEENVKASFFVVGKWVAKNPDILKAIYDDSHYIANHSYTHEYSKIYKNMETLNSEIQGTEREIKKVLGEEYNTYLFRFPGGSFGGFYHNFKARAKEFLKTKKMCVVDWNTLTGDSVGNDSFEKQFKEFEKTRNTGGMIILMHDTDEKINTVETARAIIKQLKKEGYVFKTFYDIFKEEKTIEKLD